MNSTTETRDQTFNGWTNRATWCVNLWLTNEPYTYEELSRIAHTDTQYTFQRDEMLKEFVEETFELPTTGLAADLIGQTLAEVNWREIIDAARED